MEHAKLVLLLQLNPKSARKLIFVCIVLCCCWPLCKASVEFTQSPVLLSDYFWQAYVNCSTALTDSFGVLEPSLGTKTRLSLYKCDFLFMKIVFFLHIFHVTFIKFTTSAESYHLGVLNGWCCQRTQNKCINSKIQILVFLLSGGHYLNAFFLCNVFVQIDFCIHFNKL